MSNEEVILQRLTEIQRELGTQSSQLQLMDDAIRGPRDAERPGLVQKQAEQEQRIGRLEKGAIAAGGGVSTIAAAVWAWLTKGG